jgi:uncharacterized protein (TIGR02118 family)
VIRVTVLYPAQDGAHFDHEYYRAKHMPMIRQTLGGALKGTSIEKGIGTVEPGKPPPFMASCLPGVRVSRGFWGSLRPTRRGNHG